MNVRTLQRPLSIAAIVDGGIYAMPSAPLGQSGLFLRVGCIDEVFVKVPSARGMDDYRDFVRDAKPNPSDIRGLEDAERYDGLDSTLRRLPLLATSGVQDRELLHYLAVHQLQHERLRDADVVAIPPARFGFLRSGRLIHKLEPAMFQQRVDGSTLWEMFDFDALEVTRPWWPHLPAISGQLRKLLDSPWMNHIDWNIQNFVFRPSDERLFYVDMKPTLFLAAQSNAHNLQGLRDYFIE